MNVTGTESHAEHKKETVHIMTNLESSYSSIKIKKEFQSKKVSLHTESVEIHHSSNTLITANNRRKTLNKDIHSRLPDYYTQSTKRGHKYSWSKNIGHKIC
jgi:hypothetical protein